MSCNKRMAGFKLVEKSDFRVDNLDFDYLSGKMKVGFSDGDKEIGATVNLRMKADSIIWMSVSPGLGVEVMRAQFTPDTIMIINKLKKEVYALSYSQLSERYKVTLDFHTLQSIIVGDLVEDKMPKDRVKRESSYFLLDQQRDKMRYQSQVDPLTYRIVQTQALQPTTGNSLTLQYADFQDIKSKIKKKQHKKEYKESKNTDNPMMKLSRRERKSDIFPFENTVDLVFYDQSGRTLSTKVKMHFQKVDINEKKLSFPFKVSSRYVIK
ncbi:hypothetical protein PEPS_02470 [Persicobacter psychrovividus]|uniref:DUF4292 domain-containing protein n=2 Tax=Persicobacter psychrovividus TaxID=387638 RepID=A0ABN6L4F1_9BACT|nr:hypothetical protein PEPS_02470 [Persicobacter psychrovividus]